jgi:hypothetical protein
MYTKLLARYRYSDYIKILSANRGEPRMLKRK